MTFSKEALALETLRQKIESAEFQAGDASDFLDYGKPNPVQKNELANLIAKKMAEAETLKLQLKALIQNTPRQALEEWANFHMNILLQILKEAPTDTKGKVRLHTAKTTLEDWQAVLNYKKDYVGINWYYLKDYREQMHKTTKRYWWKFW